MVKTPKMVPRKQTWWINWLLALLSPVVFLAIAEGILALAGVQPLSLTEDPYVGFAAGQPLFLRTQTEGGVETYTTNPVKLSHFNPQSFPVKKAPGVFRIFCMGGSATYGHPYHDPTSYSGWLRAMLANAEPTRQFEVINCGGISYASYREAKLMEELTHYEPDLIVEYAGHNEFLEERTYRSTQKVPTWIRNVSSSMDHLRTYSLLRRVVEKSQPTSEKKSDEKTQLAGEVDEVLSKTIGPVSYTRDDSLKQNVLNHFVLSLRRIADLAKSVGARTLFLSTPVNEKDCEPFKSEPTPGLSPEQVATAKRLLDQGRQLLDASKTDSTRLDSAAVILARGAELDPRNAEMQYWAGQAAFARRDYVRAKSYFRHAIDEDICPLRALTPMRDLVRQVAAETDSRWVDFLDSMENKSVRERGHNILGEPDFLDHVHLNAEDYGYLALGIFDEMTRMGVVHPRPGFRDSGLAQVRALVLARLNNQEEGLALHNIAKVLNWAGKHEDAARVSERALAKDSTSLEAIWSSLYLGAAYERKGRSDLAIPQYRRAIRLDTTNPEPRGFLGAALLRVGDTAAAIREFSITLSLQADNPEVHEQLGQLELSRGHLPQAVDHLRVAVAAKPDQAGLRTMLGGALLGLGRLDEAATEFHAALVRKPGTVMAWVGLGHIAEAKGNFPEAIQNYARAAQLDPQQSEARRELARLLQGGMFR